MFNFLRSAVSMPLEFQGQSFNSRNLSRYSWPPIPIHQSGKRAMMKGIKTESTC